jgi:uridine kinase
MEFLMSSTLILSDPRLFSETLFEKMKSVFPGIQELELYEFRYGLTDLLPKNGWDTVRLESREQIEIRINSRAFYDSIQIKPRVDDRIVLNAEIVRLAQMLFVGLVMGEYPPDWVNAHFYFDIRGFYFLHRTIYFTDRVLTHFGGHPYRRFEQKQKHLEHLQDVGYKAFREANAEVDQLFIQSVMKLIAARGTPILLAIAGATAAGKTEIVERLGTAFKLAGQKTTSIELDNFFTDRDDREARGVDSQGKEALHFGLFKQALEDITRGKAISAPRYNFIDGTSSHDLDGRLKPGRMPAEIEPADIIFIEGNFPFLIEEILHLIGIKVVYLTDDAVRMKRKWKRDMDYRKKYDLSYFRNRYFKDQFIMAQIAYLPQMEVCDMCVDTTGAALWTTPEIAKILDQG